MHCRMTRCNISYCNAAFLHEYALTEQRMSAGVGPPYLWIDLGHLERAFGATRLMFIVSPVHRIVAMDAVIERKTKRTDDPSTSFPSFDMPKFEFPKMEMPEAFRDFFGKSGTQAEDFCEQAKQATEETHNMLRNTYATAAKGTTDYHLKVMEMAKINSAANFNYVQALFRVTDFSDFTKLSTDHARQQMATPLAGADKDSRGTKLKRRLPKSQNR